MKKKLLVTFIIFTLFVSAVFSAGRLTVTSKNIIMIDDWWKYAYVYAKVQNTGNAPIIIDTATAELYDDTGEVLESDEYASTFASYLKPGEYTYVSSYIDMDEIEKDVDSFDVLLTSSTYGISNCTRLSCVPSLEINVTDDWFTYNYMYARVTNNTNKTQYNWAVVMALLDEKGNIIFIDDNSFFYDVGLTSGSSVIVRCDIPSSIMSYIEDNNIDISKAKVDAIAYVLEY